MRYDFMILDVFTDKPFGGNQLAVLIDARGLTTEAMQAVAREFDYPETTFVLPPDNPANVRRVRIFTPSAELPFAGHPTVGTACALVMANQCAVGDFILEEGLGPVSVSTRREGGSYSARLRIERAPEVPETVPTAADIAAGAKLYNTYCMRCHSGATVLPDLRRSAPTVLNGLDKILDGALAERGMPRFAEFDKAMIAQLRGYLLDERRKLAASAQ